MNAGLVSLFVLQFITHPQPAAVRANDDGNRTRAQREF
jgi:hypothetical protein